MSSTVIVLEELLIHIFGIIWTVFVTLLFVFLFKLLYLYYQLKVYSNNNGFYVLCAYVPFLETISLVKPHLNQVTVAKLQLPNYSFGTGINFIASPKRKPFHTERNADILQTFSYNNNLNKNTNSRVTKTVQIMPKICMSIALLNY